MSATRDGATSILDIECIPKYLGMYRLPMTSNQSSQAIGRLKLAVVVNLLLATTKVNFTVNIGARQHIVEENRYNVVRTV